VQRHRCVCTLPPPASTLNPGWHLRKQTCGSTLRATLSSPLLPPPPRIPSPLHESDDGFVCHWRHAWPFPRDGEGVGWAGVRVHTPSRVPHPWGATSYREVAPLTYVLASVQVHVFVHHSALPVRSEAVLRDAREAVRVMVHAEAAAWCTK